MSCQDYIELDGVFRDAREYRSTKHQITIQANNEIYIGLNEKTEFYTDVNEYLIGGLGSTPTLSNPQPNFLVQAEERIEISANHTSRINEGSIVRLRNESCEEFEEGCGFNYKKEQKEQNDNNFYSEEEILKIYPNPKQRKL